MLNTLKEAKARFDYTIPETETICKICNKKLWGNPGIATKEYIVCNKCKDKKIMKINELKVGDRKRD